MRLQGACAASLVFLASLAGPAYADPDPIVTLDEVLVTAPQPDATLRSTPHGVTVITAADIARSTALNVGELLSRQANVNLQSFFGNDRNAAIDIRGMGATATSNVLVLVDGVQLNDIDLSGADLATVPLAQIERIEIVRGGGAVRYGSGAVGGVINIITKRGVPGQSRLELYARAGSYDTTDLRVNGSGSAGPFVGTVNLSKFDTNGYRQNNDVSAQAGEVELRLLPTGRLDFLDVFVRAARYTDEAGLPGPVSAQAFAAGESARRASRAPNDRSSTQDNRYTAGANADFGTAGQLSLLGFARDRENPYVIGYSPLIPLENQQSLITSQSRQFTARYDLPFEAFGYSHSLNVGVDRMAADYSRSENGKSVVGSSALREGDVNSRGVYASATLRAAGGLTFTGGIRANRFTTSEQQQLLTRQCQTVFETVLIDILPGPGVILVPVRVPRQSNCVDAFRVQATQSGNWRNRGAEAGVTWQANQALTAFASVTKNFRDPNVDELLLAAVDLQPQTGTTLEAGMRYALADRVQLAATVFDMTINDEIYFGRDPVTGRGLNRNFDLPTRRTGFELEARWRVLAALALRANFGFVNARFEGTGANVPLVPATNANVEVDWTPLAWLQSVFSARYVGARNDGNDFDNTRYAPLPAYTVCDAVLRFTRGDAQLSAGVNNLFNTVYSTVGYSGTYYPMPGRNFYASIRLRF